MGLKAQNCKWSTGMPPQEPVHCTIRIRYGHRGVGGEVLAMGERAIVRFESPERAVAPGQAVVFYQGDLVIGGGWITEATKVSSEVYAQQG